MKAVPKRQLRIAWIVILILFVSILAYAVGYFTSDNRQEIADLKQNFANEKADLENRVNELQEENAELKGTKSVNHQLKAGATVTKDLKKLQLTFAYIPPGEFTMGSPDDDPGREDDEPQHKVTLTRGFYMQTTEVTVGQWRIFIDDTEYQTDAEKGDGCYNLKSGSWEKIKGAYWDNPGFDQTDKHPVTCVSWNDAKKFVEWLNTQGKENYRLPTEAEWEYACRARTTTPFAFGKCLSTDDANYDGNYPLEGCPKGEYRGKTIPVVSLKANDWGLYDMHGNVWEWCEDWYGDYPSGSVTDPVGPKTGSDRVIRGGSWNNNAANCRSANRNRNTPDNRNNNVGFRVCFFSSPQYSQKRQCLRTLPPCTGADHCLYPAPGSTRTKRD